MISEASGKIIFDHAKELSRRHTGLVLNEVGRADGSYLIQGLLRFTASFGELERLAGEYHIEIQISEKYPDVPPVVRDIGGKVDKGFHTNPDDTLCLGAPLAVKMRFAQQPDLIGFVDNCIVPHLYSFEYWKKHGVMPFGELSHGADGILEYYQERFGAENPLAIIQFLKILADDGYRGHLDCPCGSGSRLRKCHGDQVRNLHNQQTPVEFVNDQMNVMYAVNQKGIPIPKSTLCKTAAKELDVEALIKKGVFY